MTPSINPTFYRVRNPTNNKFYNVPEHDLDQAISLGGEVVNDNKSTPHKISHSSSDSSNEYSLVKSPSGKIYKVPNRDLNSAKQMGGKVITTDELSPPIPEEDTIGKFSARSAKSLTAGALGGVPDTIASIYNIPAHLENAKTSSMKQNNQSAFAPESFVPEAPVYPDQKLPIIPSVTEKIDSDIDKLTNDYTKTKEGDSIQEGLKTIGAVASPGGLSKLAGNIGMKATSKALGTLGTTNPIGLAAAGAAGYGSSEATKAGYGALGAIGAGLGSGAAVGAVGAIGKSLLKSLDVKLALATLTGNSPKNIDLDVVKSLEMSGLPFTNTLVNKSNALALADQTISKAPLFGTRRAKKLDLNDKAYASAVEDSIKKVGDKIIESDSPLDIGSMIKDTFSNVKQSVINEKDILYDEAISLLPKESFILPENLMHAIDSVRGKIKTLRASSDQTFVLNYLNDVEKGILIGGAEGKRVLAPVPMDMLVGSKVSLNDIIDWDIKASGPRKLLNEMHHAMKEDIAAYGKKNPEWYKKFSEADGFYGKYLGDEALGSDTLKNKIFSQDDPEKILLSLNKISDFKNIKESLGRDESGQKFFDSIKRQKLSDLLMGKLIDPKTGHVSYNGFSKVFASSENKELVKYLAGDQYKQIINFNEQAKAAIRRNQRIPNPSGTAPTKTVISALGGAITGAFIGGVAGAVTGGVYPLLGLGIMGQGLSWLVSNKLPLKWGIEGAKKQASGNFKAAETYSNRIQRAMQKDMGDDFVRQFLAISNDLPSLDEESREKNH